MQYRRLGNAGIKVSVLSFGSWLTFGSRQAVEQSIECMGAAYEAGVNFFDNAEVYSGGQSETVMGEAIKELGWARHSYLVSTKFFWGIHGESAINAHWTLNRKYLMEAVDKSLERLGLDHVDLIYCHRPDPETPIEETVWAMSDIVASGRALYWGTSEWSADEIRAAWEIAERHHLRKPVVEQPEYNLFNRTKVEDEYRRLYEDIGLGLTTWSPLASGLLTGKYLDGIPEGSRGESVKWLQDLLTNPESNEKVRSFMAIADDIGCTAAQLALAWTASNTDVSTVITGASRVEQVHENMKALGVLAEMTPERKEAIDAIFA
ncbi:MAG: aldo/keto reductase [Acidimicrobiia bacterium]|nr:aldo/keto reductase [Acidimicrobiia bacterium]NNK90932.1 aldo/keto reductase [Acidimicrobiia bacterium]